MARTRMFVGSAHESVAVAKALVSHFQDDLCEAVLWEYAFNPGRTTLAELQRAVRDHQYAAFVFTPDDTTLSRGSDVGSPRDNVILEMGLFCNAYGTERCFAVMPDNEKVKIPSDLLGIGFATYHAPTEPGVDHNQWKNRLIDAAEKIRSVVQADLDAEGGHQQPVSSVPVSETSLGIPIRQTPEALLVSTIQAQAQLGMRPAATDLFPGRLVVHALYGVGQVLSVGPAGSAFAQTARIRFSEGVGDGELPVGELFDAR